MNIKIKFDKKNILHYFYIAIIIVNIIGLYLFYNFLSENVLSAYNPEESLLSEKKADINLNKFESVIEEIEKKSNKQVITATTTSINNIFD